MRKGLRPLWAATRAADRFVPVEGRWPGKTVPLAALRAQLELILDAWGVPEVQTVIDHVLYADLHGVDSHGVAMVPSYERRGARLTGRPQLVHEDGATGLIDGGGGLGHLPADQAMRLAIEKARAHGVGAVAVRNSDHFGAAGAYAALARDQGLIGLATTTTEGPAIVPTFGADPKLGTNAIAFAAGEVLLDMATSTTSIGRARTEWRKGKRMPKGWAVTAKGRPLRRAWQIERLTPLGSTERNASYKGYGLAVMVEVLSRVLGGGSPVGHFLLALDPARFGEGFEQRAKALTDELRSTRPLDPGQSVLVPGDPERTARQERERSGIPLTRSVVEDLRDVARRANVPFTL